MRLATLLLRIPDDWMGGHRDISVLKLKIMICAPKRDHCELSLMIIEEFGANNEKTIGKYLLPVDLVGKADPSKSGMNRILSSILAHSCRMCAVLRDSDCLFENAILCLDGNVRWNIIAPNDATLNRLVADIRDAGIDVRVEKTTLLRTMRELTIEQERILQSAFDFGYFDIPKKIKLETLARCLNMPEANLGVILKRARRKIVANHLESFRHRLASQ